MGFILQDKKPSRRLGGNIFLITPCIRWAYEAAKIFKLIIKILNKNILIILIFKKNREYINYYY